MGKIIDKIITRFDSGMKDDFRSTDDAGMAVVKHFDIHNYPHKLGPIRAPAAITGGHVIGNIIVGTDGLFYGLGTDDSNPTLQKLWNIPDPATPVWTAVANSLSGAAVDYSLFVEYKNYFYTARSGYIMRFDRAGVASSNTTYSAVSWTNIAQGVVHPKDDILYIPYDNKIWLLNSHAGTPNIVGLTLSSSMKINAIAPFGNYLAIACSPVNNVALGSVIYLWDRDASLTTVTESIDWGTGIIKVLNVLDGYLVGISDVGGSSSSILDYDNVEIKFYTGGVPQLISRISTRKQTTTAPDAVINPRVNFISGGKMYFSLTINGGGTSPSINGLWTIGKNTRGNFVYGIERMATTGGTETGVIAAGVIGNYAVMVHTASGTTSISTSSQVAANVYTATSSYESLIFNGSDSSLTKKLLSVTVMTEPLPTNGQIVLKYRKDNVINSETTGWTTIFTHTTDNSLSHQAINIEGAAEGSNNLPQFNEIQFRIESTGGASITGLKWRAELIDNQPN